MSNKICVKAPAKINLTLDIIGRRDNGYHDLKMIMQTIDLYDEITIAKTGTPDIILNMDKDFTPSIPQEKNLAWQAAALMQKKFSLPYGFKLELKKRIPVAAGLAGGSTDCGAALLGINSLCSLGLTKEELCELGVTLGADVPFCIQKGTMLAEGIGEILTPLPDLAPLWVLLIKPNLAVQTGEVYREIDSKNHYYHPNTKIVVDAISHNDAVTMSQNLSNVLESVTITKYPVLNHLKEFFLQNGACGSLMTGSGPTIYGIFQDATLASLAQKLAMEKYSEYDIILCQTKVPEELEKIISD